MPATIHKPSPKPIKPGPKPVQSIAPQGETPKSAMLKIEQPKATIEKKYPDGSSTTEEVEVGPPKKIMGHACNVGVTMGMTKNLGDYNNFKFSVALFMPSEMDPESVESTYELVKAWVDQKVEEINHEIEQQMSG